MDLPTHVRFAHPEAGWGSDQSRAAEHLEPGKVYPLQAYHVGFTHSWVELYGFRGLQFNAVQFETAGHDEYEGQGS